MTAIAALVLSLAASGDAQSLSDAAKRAEDQRREQAGQKVQILEPPVERVDEDRPKLSEDLIARYQRARLTLVDLIQRDKPLQQHLTAATRTVRHFSELIPIFESEPAIVTLLDAVRFTPRLYISLNIVLLQIQDRQRYPTQMRPPDDYDKAAMKFVAQHRFFVERVMQDCSAYEHAALQKGLRLWYSFVPSVW